MARANRGRIIGSDEFDILSAIWILASNDENPIITYDGIKYRLGLPDDYDVKSLVQSHGELFRQRIPVRRLQAWKQDMRPSKRLPLWIRDIENIDARNQTINALNPDDAFRSQFRAGEDAPRSSTQEIEWGLQHIDRLRKAVVEDREQKVKWKMPLLIALITALLTLGSTVTVQYLTSRWGISNQLRMDKVQKRRQVFGELMGRKFLTTQLYVSRFEALIYSDYHESKWKHTGYPKDSIDLQEAQRWMRKSEDLALEISRNNQSLFETIGLIRTLFPNTPQLDELVNRIYHFRTPKISLQAGSVDPSQLEAWKLKAAGELQNIVDNEFAKPIDDLLVHLSTEITKDAD